ncbi:MAG: hypothetical protein Q8941_20935 [Bacteroidota bacterium]|nr:hypothetical protein [Bacteroidota bacterium]
MKFLFIPLVIIVITALVFGYFGYQAEYLVNIPLIIANITGMFAFIVQIRFRKTPKIFTNEPGNDTEDHSPSN